MPWAGESGVCRFCHTGCDPAYSRCFPCHEAANLDFAIEVLPIAMSVDGQLLHHHLRGYKDGRTADVRGRMTVRLAALVAVYLARHAGCVGEFDSVVTVPSPARTAPDAILQLLPSLSGIHLPTLVATGVGTKDELRPDRFTVSRNVDAERILLFDDTFTRGSTIFSAAAALRSVGATIMGPLVLGRHIQPKWPPSEALLAWLGGRPWDDARCCRCNGEHAALDQLPY